MIGLVFGMGSNSVYCREWKYGVKFGSCYIFVGSVAQVAAMKTLGITSPCSYLHSNKQFWDPIVIKHPETLLRVYLYIYHPCTTFFSSNCINTFPSSFKIFQVLHSDMRDLSQTFLCEKSLVSGNENVVKCHQTRNDFII